MKKFLLVIVVGFVCLSGCKKEEYDKCKSTIAMSCQHGRCDPSNGGCICDSGYYGVYCQFVVQACSTQHFGKVQVNSSHSDPYEIYIDGVYKGIQYYGTTYYDNISSGYVTISEYQVNYIFSQNTYSQGGNLSDCGTLIATY